MRNLLLLGAVCALALPGCRTAPAPASPEEEDLARAGDEIMVAGRLFHTGTPVTLWFDEGGYNAYRVDGNTAGGAPHFGDRVDRFGFRDDFSEEEKAAVADGWTLEELGGVVDQFVMHYDVCGTSAVCFDVLHGERGLSVHFLLDADGRIYQTLDLSERAWHAAKANSRSIGVEIANIGAYPPDEPEPLETWYTQDAGGTRLTIPEGRNLGHLDPDAIFRPARNEAVEGPVHTQELRQYDLTDAQYDALVRLTATLVGIFPRLPNAYPVGPGGEVRTDVLSDAEYEDFSGLIGHFHLSGNKIDPGPAFDWERLTTGVAEVLAEEPAGSSPADRGVWEASGSTVRGSASR